MDESAKSCWNLRFSRVYIEDAIRDHPRTRRILSGLPHASRIRINHYKDVFCRKNQDFSAQKNSPQLILAQKKDTFLYEGSPMCDSFGNKNFYYTNDIMNCPYQCEYCYLQGLYPSANLVIFVNLEDTLLAIEEKLSVETMYICISYDTDLLALESRTGFVGDWITFSQKHPSLTIELRTKSAMFHTIAMHTPPKNLILAWTLSPEMVIREFEHRTPSLDARLESMRQAMERGWNVRLCVDPVIHVENWEKQYRDFACVVKEGLDIRKLENISIGVFRLPKDSLKVMRKINPTSSLLAYPFTLSDTGWSYSMEQKNRMMDYIGTLFS